MNSRSASNPTLQRVGGLVLLLACVLCWPARALAGAGDEWEREAKVQLLKSSPVTAEIVERGEKLLDSGHLRDAAALLEQAAQNEPKNALVARIQCRIHTELGSTQVAILACRRALAYELTPKDWPGDMLAMVRALLSAKERPTSEHLYQALSISSSLMRKVPNQPWPHLAQCEIASRLENVSTMRLCDPTWSGWALANAHYDSVRGVTKIRRFHSLMWSAWLALTGICLATLIHAVRAKRRERRMPRNRTIALLTSIIVVALFPGVAFGQSGSVPQLGDVGAMPIDDKNPEGSVPTASQRDRDPLGYAYFVMDITGRAEKATKHGNHTQAVLYYRALVKATPNKSVSYSRLCSAYEALQDWPNALTNCRTALAYDGVKDVDYAKYAHLLMEHKPRVSSSEVQDLDAIVQQLRTEAPNGGVADLVECEVGVKLHDQVRLKRCTANLEVLGPNDPKTLSFKWAYAVERRDYAQAKSLLEQLRQTAISKKTLNSMEAATSLALPIWRRALTHSWLLAGFGTALVALALFFLARRQYQQPIAAK